MNTKNSPSSKGDKLPNESEIVTTFREIDLKVNLSVKIS